MNINRYIATLLCVLLFVCSLSGCKTDCPANSEPATESTTTPATEETIPETEARMPIITDDTISLYYDDYFDISSIAEGQATVEIIDQQVTSTIVGSEDADNAVVYYHKDKNCLIAVGTGTATVAINDKPYQITVTAAPISLFMITGHSIGAGQTGVAAQSVLCADGQAYSMYGAKNVEDYVPGKGIGFAAPNKPKEIDAFTSAGEGTIGEGGALAWQWNNLTGEKVWVLNAAVGGSCLNEWVKDTKYYNNSVSLFKYAQSVLTNEINAGHYRLKNMAIIYHSAANYTYKGVTYDDVSAQAWYDSMWNGYKKALSYDMDGDGEAETVQAMGFVPIWSSSALSYDKPANFYMAASDSYADMFMASLISKNWITDAGVQKYFPDISYKTHGQTVEKPLYSAAVFSDGVHYVQSGYNALGIDIADNIYNYFRTKNEPIDLTLDQPDGDKVYEKMELRLGKKLRIVPHVEPITVNDLTFTVSDNLEITYPLVITAKAVGTGTLTVSYGNEVLTTITINVKE